MIAYLAVDEDGDTKILGTAANAKAVNKDFQQIDIPMDKPGLLGWIQQMLDETLNAANENTITEQPVVVQHEAAESSRDLDGNELAAQIDKLNYTSKSFLMDDLWDKLPMARKFHFAGMAMDDGENILAGLAKPNGT